MSNIVPRFDPTDLLLLVVVPLLQASPAAVRCARWCDGCIIVRFASCSRSVPATTTEDGPPPSGGVAETAPDEAPAARGVAPELRAGAQRANEPIRVS